MTVKVGDKVRIVGDRKDLTVGNWYEVICTTYTPGEVGVIDDVGERNYVMPYGYDTITSVTTITTLISTQCRDKMEECMGNGRYVKAVKWAQIAELVEALENEE